MRGKIAKQVRKIARRYSTSENKSQDKTTNSHVGSFSQRVLEQYSTKKLVKRIKQLLDSVSHQNKRCVMNTLELDENGFFQARMR